VERGRSLFAHRGKPGWHLSAVFETPGRVAGLDDFAVMGQPIEQCGRHLCIAEYTRPVAEREIGSDNNGGALVEPADQMEEQLAASLSERQIAEFVEDDEVEPGQIIGEPSLPASAGFALHSIDEIDDGVKAAARTTADARSRDGDRQMRFAGAGSADQYDIALFGKKGTACQIADQRLVDRRVGEVEVVDVFGQRQLGNRQLILNRAGLLLGDLGADRRRCALARAVA